MRILHVPHAYAPVRGGAEWLCQRISEEAVRRGHAVRVVTGNVGAVDAYYRFGVGSVGPPAEEINGVAIARLPICGSLYRHGGGLLARLPHARVRSRASSYLFTYLQRRFTAAIAREIRDFRPDVVLALPHMVVNVQAVLRAHRRMRFPLVMLPLLHDDWSAGQVRSMTVALRQADAVIAATEVEADQLRTTYGVPAARVFVSPLGVDLPTAPAPPERGPLVLFLGRKVAEKGIPLLLEAMRRVWRDCPDATLVLAGARAPGTRAIDDAIARLPPPVRARVTSLDDVSDARKTALLHAARCLVLPSRNESFGLVLLEAMAHNTPVIAFDVPVFRSIVASGAEGLLVEPDDASSLATGILALLRDGEAAAAMGKQARRKVEHAFTWEQATSRYLRAYAYAADVSKRRCRR